MKIKTKISEISKLDKKTSPILLNFQNGEMGYTNPSTLECIRAVDKNKEENDTMAIVASADNVYRGYLGEGYPTDLVNTFVAIRNKKTNKMRLIQVEQCSMLCHVFERNDANLVETQENNRMVLLKKFGGKAALRYAERMDKTTINMDVLSSQMQNTVEALDEASNEQDDGFSKAQIERDFILSSVKPPINIEAKTVQQLFLLENMISEKLLEHLEVVAIAILKVEPEYLPFSSTYLLNKVKSVQQSKEPDSAENIRIIQICVFMDGLTQLLNSGERKNMDSVEFSQISEKLEIEIRQKFAQINHEQKHKTKYTVHKAICYFLVFAFMIENYTVNVEQIQNGLKVPMKDLITFGSYVGGTYNSKMGTLTLTLKSGLAEKKMKFIRKRK